MTVLITLTSAGVDTGNFNLYSNVDGYVAAFATGVSKLSLLGGYLSTVVPNGTTTVRVKSNADCTNYVDIPVVATTTTTTTLPNPATSILSFSYSRGVFTFNLTNPIPSTDIVISSAHVDGFATSCDDAIDIIDTISANSTIYSNASTSTVNGDTPLNCTIDVFRRSPSIILQDYGALYNGQTINVGGTIVTISIPTTCETNICTPGTSYDLSGGPLIADACGPITTVYTQLGALINTGTVLYSDAALTTGKTGWSYVSDSDGEIFNINSTTGLIGTTTGTNC
jgi:hypothetical protein